MDKINDVFFYGSYEFEIEYMVFEINQSNAGGEGAMVNIFKHLKSQLCNRDYISSELL